MGSRGGGHLLEGRWQGGADSPADRTDRRVWGGAQAGAAAVLLDVDFTEIGKVVDDVLPFQVLATAGRETMHEFRTENESKKCTEDMAADAGVCLVEDWPGGEQRFGRLEGGLHSEQVAVAQHDLQSGKTGVGAQHEETVEAGIRLDLGVIDDEGIVLGRLEEAAETLVADERLVALGELALEPGDQFGARLGVFSRLFLVAADDVAAAGYPPLMHA